jgi:predicted DNA binding CopG/RHH family protein
MRILPIKEAAPTKTKTKPKQEHKSGVLKAVGEAQQTDLDLINQHTRTPLTADQVYTFKLTLCDNEIDRQNDQFTPNALNELAALFVGKTVIFDHSWSAKNQTARIYSTTVESVQGKQTSNGQPYQRLIAMAYMLSLESNADIIASLDGGILKEGSVAFRNDSDICSICGNEYYSCDCPHWKGRTYNENGVEKTCYVTLDRITDAYEFSLVAVPAQPAAGVTKGFKDGRTLSADTVKKLSAARKLRDKAMDCINQARTIEDELVGEWPDDDEDPDDGPMGEPESDPPADTPEDPDELKAFKAKIKFIAGGKTE